MVGLLDRFVAPSEWETLSSISSRYSESIAALKRLLAVCARSQCRPIHYRVLNQRLRGFTSWPAVPAQVEHHGLGPLCYLHWRAADVPFPPEIKQVLQALYLRHRRANQVRAQVLSEILAAYETANIQTLVLKGAALAHLIYPEPGLRSMRDLDLLVKKSEARRAQSILARLGFTAPQPLEARLPDKHLMVATRHTQDILVSIEIHHNLFDVNDAASMEMDDLATSPLSFSLGSNGPVAYTLGYEDMLWHLCLHMLHNTSVFTQNRLIWVADLVSFAERFVVEIDWHKIRTKYPVVCNTLSLLHFLTPLSEQLIDLAHLEIGPEPPGIGLDFQGWPRSSLALQRQKGLWRMLDDTFFPPEWWIRLHYGLGSVQPIFWYRWMWHPLHILGWVRHLLLERLGAMKR